MSYYFMIVGTQDNPLFEYEFGTSKQGGDGQSKFTDQTRPMCQFILHSSLDIVEEVQWGSGNLYLKCVDRLFNNYVSCLVTGSNAKFLLLHQPLLPASGPGGSSSAAAASSSSRSSTAIGANPISAATEEAVRSFFMEVYENWVKAIMSPFYRANDEVRSPVFRQRVAAAGRKYL